MDWRFCVLFFLVLGVAVSACVNTQLALSSTDQVPGTMKIHFIDVGMGKSELIQSPSGKTMLVDAGDDQHSKRLGNYLKAQNISRLDIVVSSNPSNANLGGMFEIIREFSIGEYIDNGDTTNPKPYYDYIHSMIDERKIPYHTVKAGDSIPLDPAVSISVINPPSNLSNSFDRNSIVLKIVHNNSSALFMGDISYEEEIGIAKTAGRSDILKVGYWGNSMTCRQEFLSIVQPKVSVIEVLEAPSYNLPSKETIARLERSGSTVYRTDLNGTTIVTMDGEKYSVITEK